MQNKITFRLYLGFHRSDFPETPYLTLPKPRYKWSQLCFEMSIMNEGHVTCRTLYLFVCISASVRGISLDLHISHFPRLIIRCGSVSFLLSVYNEGHFTWSTKYLFSCISASIWTILLKINTASSPRIRYKRCMFGWNRSVMKGTLLGRTRYFYVHISGFLGQIFVKLHTSHFPLMRYIWCTFGCDGSMMKELYWENKARFLLYLGFHKSDFPKTPSILFPTHALQAM